jgi:ribose 1,5-bisphosphokinase
MSSDGTAKSGTLVCVVGPSGAGKDTLIQEARGHFSDDPRYVFPERLISRSSQIGERHRLLERSSAQRSEYLLCWEAHGELYAIVSGVLAQLEAGRVVVVNVSRGAIADAQSAWPRLAVIHVIAPEDVLRARLLARGREDADAIARRLARVAPLDVPKNTPLETIDNGGKLTDAAAAFIAALERLAA